MIEANGLTKRFAEVVAVEGLTFSVRSGDVTGFSGRKGAGKTTTLRMILGLQRPTSGTVAVDGRPCANLAAPMRRAGSLPDARAVQPGCTASDHLLALGRSTAIDRRRVGEALESVSARTPGTGRQPFRWARSSASVSPPRCSATRRFSCSISRLADSTREHHLVPWSHASDGRRGADRAGLQSPHGGDVGHRRRAAARCQRDGRLRAGPRVRGDSRAHAGPAASTRPGRRRRRHSARPRRHFLRRERPRQLHHRGTGPASQRRAARTRTSATFARGCVHGAHRSRYPAGTSARRRGSGRRSASAGRPPAR